VSIIGQLNLKNMKLTPIKYQEGWLYVDKEAKIKVSDWAYSVQIKVAGIVNLISEKDDIDDLFSFSEEAQLDIQSSRNNFWKVCGQSPSLSLPNIPYIEEVEESIESLAHKVMMNYLTNGNPDGDFKHSTIGADDNKNWWIAGYKAAQSKGGYSEADLRKAYEAGIHFNEESNESFGPTESKWKWDTFIESINQPKENIEIITKCSMCSMIDGHKMSCKTESLRNQTPVTYKKDGKTFLKVKQ